MTTTTVPPATDYPLWQQQWWLERQKLRRKRGLPELGEDHLDEGWNSLHVVKDRHGTATHSFEHNYVDGDKHDDQPRGQPEHLIEHDDGDHAADQGEDHERPAAHHRIVVVGLAGERMEDADEGTPVERQVDQATSDQEAQARPEELVRRFRRGEVRRHDH